MNIAAFYREKTIFVTGGSGFMGKVLIEKVLRSCPDVRKLYVLLRPKKSCDSLERRQHLLSSPIFAPLATDSPQQLDKIAVVSGDIINPNLGLSELDLRRLENEVNIIFHAAATVKFDETLRTALHTNVRSTRTLLRLARKMPNLCVFVHISTAYCNCDKPVVRETVYPLSVDVDKLLATVDFLSDAAIERVTAEILGAHPNTYTYTKALAENIVERERGHVPVVIVRPSMVTCAWREPLPGWVDTFFGPGGMLAYIGKGLARSVVGDREAVADLIPVDVCINTILAAAWLCCRNEELDVTVYNSVSGSIKPSTWGQFDRMYMRELQKLPMANVVYYSNAIFTKSIWLNRVYQIFFHNLPALLIDTAMCLCGRSAQMMKLQRYIHKSATVITHFMLRQWQFCSENVGVLWREMSEQDKNDFFLDISQIDWQEYINIYSFGVRKYLLKEDDPIQEGKRRLKIIRRVRIGITIIVFTLVLLFFRRNS